MAQIRAATQWTRVGIDWGGGCVSEAGGRCGDRVLDRAELPAARVCDRGGARAGEVAVDAQGCEKRERADVSDSAGVDQGDGALRHDVWGGGGGWGAGG